MGWIELILLGRDDQRRKRAYVCARMDDQRVNLSMGQASEVAEMAERRIEIDRQVIDLHCVAVALESESERQWASVWRGCWYEI